MQFGRNNLQTNTIEKDYNSLEELASSLEEGDMIRYKAPYEMMIGECFVDEAYDFTDENKKELITLLEQSKRAR